MNLKRLSILLLLVVSLAACQSSAVTGEDISVAGGSYKNVSPKELNTLLKDKDFVFVNVHIPFAGNIAGLTYPSLMIRSSKICPNCQQIRMPELCCTAAADI